MPLWIIYHPPTTFQTTLEKQSLAKDITAIYTAVPLPAFYVNVIFQEVQRGNFWIGGVERTGEGEEKPWIRITIQNIARKHSTPEAATYFLTKVDAVLKPHVQDKGYEWEYSVEETSRDLWKICGLVPPGPGSDEERVWVRENRAVE